MKKHLCCLVFCSALFSTILWSQSDVPAVTGAAGGYFSGQNAGLSFTVGEAVAASHLGSGQMLTLGFQQPHNLSTSLNDIDSLFGFTALIYPNPVQETVTLSWMYFPGCMEMLIEVRDIQGRALFSLVTAQQSEQNNHVAIPVTGFQAGTYILTVSSNQGRKLGSFLLQKTN